jgi:protein TonB
VDAVTRWRFVPARRGDEAIESSVVVPITFALD